MGIFGAFGKILPWKRKDELGLNENLSLGGFGGGGPGGPGMPGLGPGGMPGLDLGLGGMGGTPGAAQQYPSQPAQQQFGGFGMAQQSPQMESFQSNQAYQQSYATGKEIEVVSAKLDAIRAALETLNQRLAAIERYIQTEQDFKKRGW